MKLAIISGVLLLGLAVIITGGVTSNSSQDGAQTLGSQAIYEKLDQENAVLIDVRTTEEYRQGHIEGAELLPLQSIESGALPSTEKDATIYVYCRSGNRSAVAKQLLESAGFTSIVDLGAIGNVQSIGGSIVRQ